MTAPSILDQLLDTMRFRCIGPPRGGRVVAVAGDPSEPAVFYFGAVAGGVWKTEDAGVTWTNVSDGYLKTSSVGAIAVADSEPGVIWAGMGESTIRNDVSHGDGVYRSTDRGRTWSHRGLADTRHISGIRIHPRAPDRVWVGRPRARLRPQFRSAACSAPPTEGTSWEQVLYRDDRSGAADLALDTRNPTILYASLWQVHRNFWELVSGGPGSGLWRSTDGGTTWTEITANLGLPASAMLGKIGVAASPARSGRVWALVESDTAPGLYRSEDFGETWTLASDRQDLRYRPWYYMHVFADPAGRGHRLRQQPADVEVDRRGGALHEGAHAARRQPRSLDRPARQPAHDPGQRRRGQRLVQRRRLLELRLQPAHRAALHRGHRRTRPALLRLRHPAGQLQHRGALGHRRRRHRMGGLPHRRHRRERLRGGGPEGSRRPLRGRHRQLAGRRRGSATLRPRHRTGEARQRVARAPRRHGAG